jgi:hypothetical protein
MNDAKERQYNKNFHYDIHGDLNIIKGDTFDDMCIRAIVLALIGLILVLIVHIINTI